LIISRKHINEVEVLTGENDHIKFEIIPAAGGKIISVFNKDLKKEFLWGNANLLLETHQPGADYDANFIGGIDELLPNDIPETIDSITYPDHGELWTTPLDYELYEDRISVFGKLKLSGLCYKKTILLEANAPVINLEYTIKNGSDSTRNFLWKLHAALRIEEGDRLISDAKKGKVADLDYSRFKNLNEFKWPFIENTDASIVPNKNNSIDFFYLYDIEKAEMKLLSNKGIHLFSYNYDKKVFPYQWYFASYGGFLNHYTAILEPSTSMPISVNDAKESGQCTVLEPGQEINTVVRIYAGENINQ
jgi:hypothetical protein